MTIEEMHYDFLRKTDKVTSNQNRGFLIPEIDFILNEAQNLFIKRMAQPRIKHPFIGFEKSQRNTDDIRTLVTVSSILPTNNVCSLPSDYMYFIKAEVEMSKGKCSSVKGQFFLQQHDDRFNESPFNRSSFEWREVNGTFGEDGITLYPESGMIIDSLELIYIKTPEYMHFASGFNGGTGYMRPGFATILVGKVDCELPHQTHPEIVDLAVALITEDIASPEFQLKMAKLKFNDLI
jgi:hypothetical protein